MDILKIIQIIAAILLVASVLLQARGEQLGSTFGGAGEVFRTKRGIERVLFFSTIIFAFIFFALALVQMIK